MQTAHALRLVETAGRLGPRRAKRSPGPHPVGARSPRFGRMPRKARRSSGGWVRPLMMAILVAGEWLVLIADAFLRFYVVV